MKFSIFDIVTIRCVDAGTLELGVDYYRTPRVPPVRVLVTVGWDITLGFVVPRARRADPYSVGTCVEVEDWLLRSTKAYDTVLEWTYQAKL